MARQRQHQADDAAKAASEAAKVLQQRSQAARQEPVEKVPEAAAEERPDDWTPPKRNSEQRTAILEEIVSSRPKVEPEPEAPEPKPEPEKPAEAVEAAPEAVPEVVEAPKTVKVKVDGEEFDAPAEEVESAGGVKAYQIQRAAENRLKRANDTLAEVRRIQAEIAEQAKAKPKEPEITDDQLIASKLDAIRFGTPEEGAAALKEILSKANKPVDPNSIVEQATNRLMHDQAVKRFDQEFQDIVTNPMLLRLVVSLRNERIPQQKGHVDWENFYRAIGNEVRSVVAKPTSQATAQAATSGTTSQQSDKEARKAAVAVNIPATAARAAPPKEEKPETRDDVLRSMRKKRGLPTD